MKVTPIEIRQKTFEKVFRGYESETVDAFLNALSQEWERVMEENRMLKLQLEISEKEVTRMKDLEGTMFRTLKNAEETRAKIADEAQIEAEKKVTEALTNAQKAVDAAQAEADELTREAQRKANLTVVDAESKARFVVDEAMNELKGLERDFKAMERYKEQMVNDFKKFTSETLEHIQKFEDKLSKGNYDTKQTDLEELKKHFVTETTEETPKPTKASAKKKDLLAKPNLSPEPEEEVGDLPTVALLKAVEPAAFESSTVLENKFLPKEAEEIDDEAGDLPTLSSVIQSGASEVKIPGLQPMVSSEAAAEIQELLKEVQKPKSPKIDTEPAPETKKGGSFFDSI